MDAQLSKWAYEYECLQRSGQETVECQACGYSVASADADEYRNAEGDNVTICDACLPNWEKEWDKKERR